MRYRQPHKPPADLPAAAGNGLLDRRLFLQHSTLFAGAMAGVSYMVPLPAAKGAVDATKERSIDPADPYWRHTPGRGFSSYGQPSRYEADVVRFPSANAAVVGNGVAWCPLHKLEGMITPNGLHYERHHNGIPDIDPEHHKLLIHGMVKRSLSFSINDLLRYPMQSRICFIECGGNSNAGWYRSPTRADPGYFHGLVSCSEWTGVPLATVLQEAGLLPQAGWLIASGSDAFAMHISVPIDYVLAEGLLALYQNGERIRPENGYPLRLVLPGLEGVLNVKWLHQLQLTDGPMMTRNETAKYTELMPSGKARLFSLQMGVKSLITAPAGNMLLPEPGLYQITGLAWSGQGAIKKVEVSADGGTTWAEAALQTPVLPKAFTRFRIPWQWQGQAAVLQSRATDNQGCVQPTRVALLAQRGRHGFFHYNAIVSWAVDEDGLITHVYNNKTTDQPLSLDADW